MYFVNLVYLYFGLTALLVFVLLFGDSPAFQRTPVSYLKWLVTEAWLLALERVVETMFGERGLRMLDSATECCCESSNPMLQIAYLTIVSVGYGLTWQFVFKLLPNAYAAEYHIYTGTAAVCGAVGLFLWASMSDPGRLTTESAALHLATPLHSYRIHL
ncbi:hypothetical protein OEZ86_010506 [Tetradesmus obliquus]|nr:hypothetical protein OEZ86_010506 [Tetradesmus obliquus]